MLSELPLYSYVIVSLLGMYFYFFKRGGNNLFHLLLLLILSTTTVVELLGFYIRNNFSLYHFYNLMKFSLIFFMYRNLIVEKRYLVISYILYGLTILIWIATFFNKSYLFTMIVVGSVNVGVLVFLHLRELLMSDKIINYKKLLSFWVSVAFIVFYLPSIPFFSFWNFLKDRSLMPILYVLIVLMNVIISFGLVWSNKKVEY